MITITHRDGTVIAHPDSTLIGYQLQTEKYSTFHDAVESQWQGVIQTEDISGKEVLQSTRWLEATDWFVSTTMTLDEAMQPAYRMRRIQLVIGIVSLLLSLGLLSWIIRAYLKPMNRLQQEVVAVQQGTQERLTEPGIDELRQLVFRFNNLLAQNKVNHSKLEQRQAYLDNILESSSAGLFMTDAQGNIEYVNPHLIQITGYSGKELLAGGMVRYISESQRDRIAEQFNIAMQGQERMAVEFEFYHGEGKVVWLSMDTAPIFSSGLCIGYVGTVRDTTSEQERINALRMVANEDALTGLLNRRGIEQALENCFIEARLNNRPLLVLALDLDNFKAVNDKFGHSSGDDVLRQVAQLMRQFTRETDFLGRLGGDEFTIILPGCPHARGKRIAEDLQRTVSTMNRERENFPEVSVSIGLVSLRETDLSAADLLQRADDIAYAAKNAGRNQWISDLT